MADPLAGKREAINDRQVDVLIWPDRGRGCPVVVGQVFHLRRFNIEITRIERLLKPRPARWKAEFTRIHREVTTVKLLKPGHGDTSDPRHAMTSGEEYGSPTLCSVDPLENVHNLAPPPEGEIPPADEVPDYQTSRENQRNYEQQMTRARLDHERLPLEARLAIVRRLAEAEGVDLGRQLAAIEQRIKAAESKVRRLSLVASERAA